MKRYIEARAVEIAKYILENKTNIRKTADVFKISKTTVHNDIVHRLEKIDKGLADDIHKLMILNKVKGQKLGGIVTGKKKTEEKKKRLKEMKKKAV